MRTVVYLALILFVSQNFAQAQIGRLPLSPLQSTKQVIGETEIEITYSRPSTRGRTIFGDLVPYGEYWRTGANENTTIEFSEPVVLGGYSVPKGKYAIFTKAGEFEWELVLYADTDNWDVPTNLDTAKIVARAFVPAEKTDGFYENLNIGIEHFTNYMFDLSIYWENTKILVTFELNTRKVMEDRISDILSGPDYDDYYSAATYELESGYNFERGLEYIERAISLAAPVTWWDYRIKAYFLTELGRYEEAEELAYKGLAMAKSDERAYGIKEFENILKIIAKGK